MTDTVERVSVEIVGDVTGVNAAMRNAAESVRASVNDIRASTSTWASAVSNMRASSTAAASGFLTMEQALEAETSAARAALQPAQAFEQAAHKGHLTSARFANELLNVTRAALGFEPVLGKVGTELGIMSVGAPLIVGVFAALAGLALYWDHVAASAKKAAEEQQNADKVLQEIRDKQRNPVLGNLPGTITAETGKLQDLQADLAKWQKKKKDGGGFFDTPKEIEDNISRLTNEITDVQNKINHGHEEERRLNKEHADKLAADADEAARKRLEKRKAEERALIDAAQDAVDAVNDSNAERKRLYDEQTDDALRGFEDLLKASQEADDAAQKFNESFARGQNAAEEASKRLAKEYRDEWTRTFDQVSGSFGRAIGYASTKAGFLREVWRSVWYDMVQTSATWAAHEVGVWASKELVKSGITKKMVVTRVDDEAWGAAKTIAIKTWEGIRWIAIEAAKAAAAAWAALSGIPVIGPALGVAAAAATLAGVLALAKGIGGGGSPSVSGGGVPTAARAATAQSSQSRGNTVINVSAMDAQSFKTFAVRNRAAFVEAVGKAAKENGIPSRVLAGR